MCRSTVDCVAAVNGDFYDVTHKGSLILVTKWAGSFKLRSLAYSEISHQQVILMGAKSTMVLTGVSVSTSTVSMFRSPRSTRKLPMSYVNVNLPLAGTLLFTTQYALRIPSGRGGLPTSSSSQWQPPVPHSPPPVHHQSHTSPPPVPPQSHHQSHHYQHDN